MQLTATDRLTAQEKRSLAAARRRMHDVLVRLNCIALAHPQWATLRQQAAALMAAMEAVAQFQERYRYS